MKNKKKKNHLKMSKKKTKKRQSAGKQKVPKPKSALTNYSTKERWKKWLCDKKGETTAPGPVSELSELVKSRLLEDNWNELPRLLADLEDKMSPEQKEGLGPVLTEKVGLLYRQEHKHQQKNTGTITTRDSEQNNSSTNKKNMNELGQSLECLASWAHKATSKCARKEIHRIKSFKLGKNLNTNKKTARKKSHQNHITMGFGTKLTSLLSGASTRYPNLLFRYARNGETILFVPTYTETEEEIPVLTAKICHRGILESYYLVVQNVDRKGFYRSVTEQYGDFYGKIPLSLAIRILRRNLKQCRIHQKSVPYAYSSFLETHTDIPTGFKHPAWGLFPESSPMEPGETKKGLSHWSLEALAPPFLDHDSLTPFMESGSESGIVLTGASFEENRMNSLSQRVEASFDEDTRAYYAGILLDTAALLATREEAPKQAEWCVRLAAFLRNPSNDLKESAFLDVMTTRTAMLWQYIRDNAGEHVNKTTSQTYMDSSAAADGSPSQVHDLGKNDSFPKGPTSSGGLIIPG